MNEHENYCKTDIDCTWAVAQIAKNRSSQRGKNIFFIIAIGFLLFWLIFCAVKIDAANNKIKSMETDITEIKESVSAQYDELNSRLLSIEYSYNVLSKNVTDINNNIPQIKEQINACAAMIVKYKDLFDKEGEMFSTIGDYMNVVNTEIKLIEALMAQTYGSNWKTIAAYYILNGGN